MIQLAKVRGSTMYNLSYNDEAMTKLIVWEINPYDVDLDTLQDIINTVRPPLQPTIPAIPLNPRLWSAELTQEQWDVAAPVIPGINSGAEAADKAAQEEEMRLRNMGSALRTGLNMGPEDIPVFDNGELPPVNWSQ